MAIKEPAKKTRVTAKFVAEHRAKASKDHSPKWDGCETWTAEQFAKNFREAMNYYRLEHSGKDLKPQVIKWMTVNSYPKEIIAKFKKTKDGRCGVTLGAIASCLLRGMPNIRADFNSGRDSAVWLGGEINKIIEEGRDDLDEEAAAQAKASAPALAQPNIQDRLREAAMSMTEELEDLREKFHEDMDAWNPKEFKVLNILRGKGAKAAHARIIKDFYAPTLAELNELASGKGCEQLREGYSHMARKNVRKLIDFFTEIRAACDMLQEEAKVTRKPRVKKPADKVKVVAKLKFKKQDEPLKLVSINPIEIIGAKELWTYNTKTRKLGKYVAAEFSDLGVKGTTITGFDENKSIQKTLRKPVDQLKEFKAAGKVALRKFLDDINAVDTKLNGRTNEDIVLLKVA